jgi:uncharacterized protein with von Willebrand factor type A (vWA) domain
MTGMDFRSARDRAKAMLAPKRPKDLSKSALTPDALRDNIIAEGEAHSERFQRAVRKAPEVKYDVEQPDGTTEERTFEWTGYSETVRDVARAYFGMDEPEVLPVHDVRPENRLGRDVMQFTLAEDEFLDSRPYAKMNEAESLYGAMAYADSLRESAGTILAEHVKASEEMREASDQAQSADDMMESLKRQAKQDVAEHGTVADPTRRGIKSAMKQQAAANAVMQALLQQQAGSGQVLAAAQAAAAATQAAQEAIDAIGMLPGIGGGESQNMSPDLQMELAEKWASNDQLKAIARMVGRMYRDMRFKRETRTRNVPIEPVGITTGRDLERLLPHEMAKVMVPELRGLFVKDYSAHNLLQYEMQGTLPAGKGPIIDCCDGSGSMSGEPIVWANSLAVCLLMLAHREKRDYAHVQFGSGGQLKVWLFPANEPVDADEVLDMASHLFGGGTDTETGMRAALDIYENVPGFSTADVILIGDGQDHFGPGDLAVRDRLRSLDVRIHGITIQTGANPYFDQMCEWHVDVTDLAGSNEGTDAIAENIT